MQILKNKIVLLSFIGLSFLTSCKSKQPTVITNTYKETITERVHDTVFEIAADSSAYQALLECQNGKVVQKEIKKATPGKNLNIPQVTIKDNQLNVDCSAEAQRLFAQWTSTNVLQELYEQQPVYIEKELSFWNFLFISIGKLTLAIIAIVAFIWITKKHITAYSLKN